MRTFGDLRSAGQPVVGYAAYLFTSQSPAVRVVERPGPPMLDQKVK